MNSSISIKAARIAPNDMENNMTKLTFGAVIVAATLLATGSVWAADEPSRNSADAAAEASVASAGRQGLGYAPASGRSSEAFAHIRHDAGAGVSRADRLFLEQGDRGIGNN